MRYLSILLVLASFQVHADYSQAEFERDGQAWNKITDVGAPIETPEYRPEPMPQPIQTDVEWTNSVRQMDIEASPVYGR
jgi:hypothetical protein